jgi:thioredoxin 1
MDNFLVSFRKYAKRKFDVFGFYLTGSMGLAYNFQEVIEMTVVHISGDQFEQEVLQGGKLTVVDFWAPWCGPCKMLGPIVEELAAEYEGRAKLCKIDTDQNQDIAAQYGIASIPTLIFFKDGNEIGRKIGLSSKADLGQAIDSYL